MDPFGSDGLFEGVIRQGLGHRGPGSEISCQDWIFVGFACLRTVQFLAVQEYHVFVPLLMNWEAVQVML